MNNTLAVINPAAGRGRCAKRWPRARRNLQNALGHDFQELFTEKPGDELRLGREAAQIGASRIVVAGGDGSLNGVVNGLHLENALADKNLSITPIPLGTANEVARELGYHNDVPSSLLAAARGSVRRLDALVAQSPDNPKNSRLSLIGVYMGSGALISKRTNESRFIKRLFGRFGYAIVTAVVTLSFKPIPLTFQFDDQKPLPLNAICPIACNLEVSGGGMRIAPGAVADDGVMNVVVFLQSARKALLTKPPSWLFKGNHILHPSVHFQQAERLVVRPQNPDALPHNSAWVDVDGETFDRLPVEMHVLPKLVPLRSAAISQKSAKPARSSRAPTPAPA